jgi:hypothetical protein
VYGRLWSVYFAPLPFLRNPAEADILMEACVFVEEFLSSKIDEKILSVEDRNFLC